MANIDKFLACWEKKVYAVKRLVALVGPFLLFFSSM